MGHTTRDCRGINDDYLCIDVSEIFVVNNKYYN